MAANWNPRLPQLLALTLSKKVFLIPPATGQLWGSRVSADLSSSSQWPFDCIQSLTCHMVLLDPCVMQNSFLWPPRFPGWLDVQPLHPRCYAG